MILNKTTFSYARFLISLAKARFAVKFVKNKNGERSDSELYFIFYQNQANHENYDQVRQKIGQLGQTGSFLLQEKTRSLAVPI